MRYNDLTTEIATCPVTWLPALLIAVVERATKDGVFQDGGLLTTVERAMGAPKRDKLVSTGERSGMIEMRCGHTKSVELGCASCDAEHAAEPKVDRGLEGTGKNVPHAALQRAIGRKHLPQGGYCVLAPVDGTPTAGLGVQGA